MHPYNNLPYDDAMNKFSDTIKKQDQILRDKYYDLPNDFPSESLPPDGHFDRVFLHFNYLIERNY